MSIPTQVCDLCTRLKPLDCFPMLKDGFYATRCTECEKDEQIQNQSIVAYRLQDTRHQLARATAHALPLMEARELFYELSDQLGGVKQIAKSWGDKIKDSMLHKNPNTALRQFDNFLNHLLEFEKREKESIEVTELTDADIEREMTSLMKRKSAPAVAGKIGHGQS